MATRAFLVTDPSESPKLKVDERFVLMAPVEILTPAKDDLEPSL